MVKKFILLTFLIISSFTFVSASPSNIVQKFSTSYVAGSGTCNIIYTFTTVNGLGYYSVGHGTQFYNYQLNFNDSLSVNKAYHVKMTYYGSISDGFYVTPMQDLSYYHVYQGTNINIPIYNLTYNVESTYYRSIEFDFLNTDLSNNYSIQMHNCGSPVLYYSYSGNSSFGFTDLTIEELNQQDFNSLIVQNDIIISQNQQTNQNLTNINDSINDSSTPSNSDISSKLEDFDDFLPSNNTISSLISMPLTLFQSVLNSINATCQPFSLGSLLGTTLTLPCITLSTYLGSSLWGIIDVLFSGLFIFTISKKFIKVFENFSTLKEGDVIGD